MNILLDWAEVVLQSSKQQMVLSFEQPPNIMRISVTLLMSNDEISTSTSLLQAKNMPFRFVALEVLNELRSSIVSA